MQLEMKYIGMLLHIIADVFNGEVQVIEFCNKYLKNWFASLGKMNPPQCSTYTCPLNRYVSQ